MHCVAPCAVQVAANSEGVQSLTSATFKRVDEHATAIQRLAEVWAGQRFCRDSLALMLVDLLSSAIVVLNGCAARSQAISGAEEERPTAAEVKRWLAEGLSQAEASWQVRVRRGLLGTGHPAAGCVCRMWPAMHAEHILCCYIVTTAARASTERGSGPEGLAAGSCRAAAGGVRPRRQGRGARRARPGACGARAGRSVRGGCRMLAFELDEASLAAFLTLALSAATGAGMRLPCTQSNPIQSNPIQSARATQEALRASAADERRRFDESLQRLQSKFGVLAERAAAGERSLTPAARQLVLDQVADVFQQHAANHVGRSAWHGLGMGVGVVWRWGWVGVWVWVWVWVWAWV